MKTVRFPHKVGDLLMLSTLDNKTFGACDTSYALRSVTDLCHALAGTMKEELVLPVLRVRVSGIMYARVGWSLVDKDILEARFVSPPAENTYKVTRNVDPYKTTIVLQDVDMSEVVKIEGDQAASFHRAFSALPSDGTDRRLVAYMRAIRIGDEYNIIEADVKPDMEW